MSIHRLNPLADPRWPDLVQRHQRSSAFHRAEWLEALHRTYGYQPVAFTTSPPEAPLTHGIVFCEIRSWVTGHRLVSLPFSDHCEPLVDRTEDAAAIYERLHDDRVAAGWRSIEVRPLQTPPAGPFGSQPGNYWLHLLDLRPGADRLLRSFDQGSIQRKIRRAAREGLVHEEGRSEALVREFYELLVLTRQRHGLPPQPLEWFRQLAASFGPAITVRIARRGVRPIAGIVTLLHRDTMVYKYGASDAAVHRLGGMQLLLWRAIQDACSRGCQVLDMGRSDAAQSGLLTFKDRWGGSRQPLTYWRDPAPPGASMRVGERVARCATVAFGHGPAAWRIAAGRFLYKHVG